MQSVLANGASIPSLGFGTYGMHGQGLVDLIRAAVREGFRHVDTAQIYRNEAEVGEGIKLSGVPRSEVFITTKVWVTNYPKNRFMLSVDESLLRLQADYIDLLLLHWPSHEVPFAGQIDLLNDAVKSGKVRHIGISNFNRTMLADAVKLSKEPLVANQFEMHPYLDQSRLLPATMIAGLSAIAYCAMAVGRVFSDPTLAGIAEKYGRTVSQIVLRWLIQQPGVAALSRTSKIERIADNLRIFDFELEDEDMKRIGSLAVPGSRIVDPPGLAPRWD